MYDAGKIIPGLVIFFALVSFPAWHNALSGTTAYKPEPEIVTKEEQCVEPKQYMTDNHSALLNEWKEAAVRDSNRTYVASDGKTYDINLTGTCMDCHSNKAEFCDRCHDYAGVNPNCWYCHVAPEEAK
jgi:hypothetical protein